MLGCHRKRDMQDVNLTPTQTDIQQGGDSVNTHEKLRFAIGAVISPERTYSTYNDFVRYIGERLGQPYEMVQRKTYGEINELLYMENVQAGLVCTGAYLEGREKFGIEALVVPVCHGKPVYYSYVIVPKDSLVENFEQLRGRRFAFSDPLSNSGYNYPMYLLILRNEMPETFFSKYIFTYSHDNSLKAVMEGLVDAAAVDSLIYDYDAEIDPNVVERTKIINKSAAFCINPVVVPPRINPRYKDRLKKVLLTMHEVPEGREILEKLKIDRFVEADDSAYRFASEVRKIVQGAKPTHARVMEIFQEEMGEIIDGLTTDNMKKVETAGEVLKRLYYKYDINDTSGRFDKKGYSRRREEFELLDRKLHSLAGDLSQDAKTEDKAKLLEDFAEILQTCIDCHQNFRVEQEATEHAQSLRKNIIGGS